MMSSIFSKLGVLLSPRSPPSPPSPQINTSALRRIYKEWNDFQADPPATCTAEPSDDMFKWRAEITPRSNSPDDDAETFVLDIEFPQHYPLLPPKVTLLNTNIDHPNIDSQGRLHVNSKMLDNWYPQFTISEALSSISSELTNAKIFAKIYGHLDIKIDGDLHISPYQYESGYFPVQIDRRIDVMLNDVPRKLHFIRNIYVAERWKHCADSIKYIVKQLFTLRIGQTYSYAWSPRFHQVLFEAGESNCRFYVDCGHELLEVEYEQVVYTVKLPYCSSDCGCFKSHERDCGRKIRCQIAETLEHVHNGRVEENNQTWRIRDKHNGNEIVSIDSSKPADIEKLYDNGERKLLLSLQDTQDEVKSDDSQPVESGANADDNKNEEENKKQNEHGLFSVKVDDKVQQPANNQFGGGGLPPAPSQDSSSKDAYWECQSCTFVNSVQSPACKICSNPQPKSANNSNAQQSNNKKKPNSPPPPQVNQYGGQQQMYGQKQPGPPPPPQHKQPPQAQHQHNHMMNNGNAPMNAGNNPPPPMVDPMANQGGNMAAMGMGGAGGGGAQEADEATMALIRQMMEADMCVLCKKQQGFELPCSHNVCGPCVKKYILNGIATMKWKKQSLACPNPSGCKGVIPTWVLKECGLGIGMQKKVEEMQNKFMIESDPTITSCPKCRETYSTETGDVQVNNKEKGPDGKPLQYRHIEHKAKYRFRCSKEQCKTIFCSGCLAVPYHIGYTCPEYKAYKESQKCRFCEKTLDASNMAPKDFTLKDGLNNVCNDAACLEKRRWSCDEVLQCGHNCIGLMGHECIKCMNPKCMPKGSDETDEEFCNICWVDPLRMAPCVKLGCGHFFHFMCLWQKIDRKWPAARITFGFLNCPLCKQPIHHPALEDITKQYYDLKAEIQKDAVERVKIEGLQNDKRITDPNSPYYKNLDKYALDRLAFYPCSKCKKPYFGGMKACEEAGLEQAENYKQEHLVCGSCASGPNAKSCKKHGKKYITYKCKFCCSVSSWYCWGSTHFCDSCHKKQEQGDYLNRKPISALPKCPGKDKCPLGIEHPANGTAEFSLGCVVCLRR